MFFLLLSILVVIKLFVFIKLNKDEKSNLFRFNSQLFTASLRTDFSEIIYLLAAMSFIPIFDLLQSNLLFLPDEKVKNDL